MLNVWANQLDISDVSDLMIQVKTREPEIVIIDSFFKSHPKVQEKLLNNEFKNNEFKNKIVVLI